MIVSCEKCSKNFSIRDDLIPEEGRLLQCGKCNYKWFYKSDIKKNKLENENRNNIVIDNSDSNKNKKSIEKNINDTLPTEKKEFKKNEKIINKSIKKAKYETNIVKRLAVLIISIIAIIILFDTFKYQLENYIPGLNIILNNLYETLKDLYLFAKDLIK